MITIRPASLHDIPSLADLWYEKTVMQVQTDPRLKLAPDARGVWAAAARGWLVDPNTLLLVAEDTEIVGYIVGWVQNAPPGLLPTRLGMVSGLAIDAHGYHAGAGRALVDALRDRLRAQGVEHLIVWTARRSATEQAFWRSLGATDWMDILWL